MILGKVFERFARHSPVTVMMRGILEYAFPPKALDELFREHAVEQYEDELLFSTTVNTLSLAVSGVRFSVNDAYKACQDEFTVSVNSLYNKLKGVETQVSQALVRESAERLAPLITKLRARDKPLLRGYRVKIIDGKHLDATEHRIEETRTLNSAPLPGLALAVLDPQLRLIIDVFPCEDAYTQERALLPEVLETVQKGDLWIEDRNLDKCVCDIVGRRNGSRPERTGVPNEGRSLSEKQTRSQTPAASKNWWLQGKTRINRTPHCSARRHKKQK